MRVLERRLARLEAVSRVLEETLVDPETLREMAAVVLDNPRNEKLRPMAERVLAQPIEDVEAERARVREKLMSDGPHVSAASQPGVASEARLILRQKLLGPDVLPAGGPAIP